jgi:hypothetical protein
LSVCETGDLGAVERAVDEWPYGSLIDLNN